MNYMQPFAHIYEQFLIIAMCFEKQCYNSEYRLFYFFHIKTATQTYTRTHTFMKGQNM